MEKFVHTQKIQHREIAASKNQVFGHDKQSKVMVVVCVGVRARGHQKQATAAKRVLNQNDVHRSPYEHI